MMKNRKSIMLATLGGQPQVITFALDALLEQGESISEVIILYLSDDGGRITRALEKVAAEFVDECYAGHPCRLRPISLRSENVRLPDIRDEEQANAAWEMLRDLVIQLKKEYYQLHGALAVAGG
jgi:CRISPR-associated protein Csx14